VKVGTNI